MGVICIQVVTEAMEDEKLRDDVKKIVSKV